MSKHPADQDPTAPAAGTSPWAGIPLHGGAAALALLTVLDAGLEITDSDDLWWGMAAGRVISRDLLIPDVDVFSHTFAGRPWINPEWLSHVLFYNVYHHLGENWLVTLRVGLIASIFGVALAFCVERSRSWLISLGTVAAGAWVCRPFLDVRPQLFTFLYSILLLYLLHLFRRRRRHGVLYLVPLLMLLWTQQHGGYFFGLLVLAGNLTAETGKRLFDLPADPLSWRAIRALGLATAASAAAMLINPWGTRAFSHPLEMSRLVSGDNVFLAVTQEWLPPTLFASEPFNPIRFSFFLCFAALAILPVAAFRWRRFDLNDAGLAAVLVAAFALQHRRFIPLFVILTLPLLTNSLELWTGAWLAGRGPRTRARAATLASAVAWLLFLCLLPWRLLQLHRDYAGAIHGRDSLFDVNTHQVYYPGGAVRFLRQAAPRGEMFNLYNWGGYLAFFLPEHGTFIDGRAQTVFDEEFHRRYLEVRTGSPGWRAVLERHGVGFALLHSEINAVLFEAMDRDPEWRWIFGDGDSRLLVERGANRDLLERFEARALPLPETATTHLIYARQAAARGDLERAADDLRRACELAPGDDALRARRILALASAGRAEEAEAASARALETFPDSPAVQLAAARLEAASGRLDDAYRRFEEAFRRWPDRLDAVDAMLEIDLDRARATIEEVYRADPQAPWRSYAMGRVAELENRRGDAHRFYNAEGLAAERAGDQVRLVRSQQATDRLTDRPADGETGDP